MTEQTAYAGRLAARRRAYATWSPIQRQKLEKMWNSGAPMELICDELDRSEAQIYYKVNQMGLPPRRKKTRRKRKLPGRDREDQRRFVGVENSKGPRIILSDHHPAMRKGTTFFPGLVKPAGAMIRLLKSGHHSRKIGDRVTKGRWKRMPIFTLTLEERDTCPRSCKEFATCYGNNMPFSERIHDDGTLTKRLWGELAAISAEHPAGFVVRLHVLGDFFSIGYVEFWRQALEDFPALRIFGFTARRPDEPVGAAVLLLTADHYDRFRVRFSGGGHGTDCAEVVDKAEDVNFVRCPAEIDPNRCCATCALCMNSNVSISFVRH